VEYLPLAVVLAASLTLASVHAVGRARRRQRLAGFAFRFGLEYSPVDRFALIDHSFDLFNMADGARCRNVVWGTWHGVPVKAAELRFAPSLGARRDGQRGKLEQYSFAFVEVPAWLPHLSIRREPLGGLADDLGLHPMRLEWGAFNRAFRVECEDRQFAYAFLDVRMMQWLMDVARHSRFRFEARAGRLLVSCPRLGPDGMVPLLGVAQGFHDHVPRMVLREYATKIRS
jgi:hypothetical protein